jgi:hypothetical protein
MVELAAIDIGKARCLLNLRFFAAAFLALAVSFGLPVGAAAQGQPDWDLEIVVVDSNTTIFRCNSEADFAANTNDCSDNQAEWDCNGEVIAVQRDELGGCATRFATAEETLTLVTQQEELVDIILANLDNQQEVPGGGPQNALEGLLNPNVFQSTEFNQTQTIVFPTQVIDGTPNVTNSPAVLP